MESWSNVKDPVVHFERNLFGHPLAGLLWDRRFEEVEMDLGWKKMPNWKCLIVHRKQGLLLSIHVNDIKMAGENQNMAPMWKKLMKDVDLDEPTSFLYHEKLGCTQRECKPNEDIFNQYGEMFESRIFCWSNWKITRVGTTSRKDGRVVLRHGRTCSKMRSEKLRTGKQKDRAVIQSRKSLLGWSSFQGGGTGISWRIVKSMLTNCLHVLVPGTNW